MAKNITLVTFAAAVTVGRLGLAGTFEETFSGSGDFTSTGYTVNGFELPDWRVAGSVAPSFLDGALKLDCNASGPDLTATINLRRTVDVDDSFIERVELRSVDLGNADGNAHGIGHLVFERGLSGQSSGIYMGLFEADETPNDEWNIAVKVGNQLVTKRVKQGTDIAFETRFLRGNGGSTIEAFYYSNALDRSSRMAFGPFSYQGGLLPNQLSYLSIGVTEMLRVTASLDNWSVHKYSGLHGDFDGDGNLTVNDLDQLSYEIMSIQHVFLFDVNADDKIDSQDLQYWIHDLKKTYYGDANLDGEFNSTDLVDIFAAGKYEDSVSTNARWDSGDWNADLEFDTSDLVVAFQDGGYEQGPRPVLAVPESLSLSTTLLGTLCCFRCIYRGTIARIAAAAEW